MITFPALSLLIKTEARTYSIGQKKKEDNETESFF